MNGAEDVLSLAARWLAAGEPVALATVIETWGSSPRPVGSRMAVSRSGDIAGSVSGGCVEAAVLQAALACLETGVGREMRFGVSDARAWEVGLPCGGELAVWVEPIG